MKDLVFNISTQNGTGSLSANQLLTRILFRSGWNVGAYNFFPSNIAGLPCLYSLRISLESHTSFNNPADVLIALNPKTFKEDLKDLKKEGLLISDVKNPWDLKKEEGFKGTHWQIPFIEIIKEIPELSPKQKILFKNIVYVSLICHSLKVDSKIIAETVQDFFQKKKGDKIIEQNLKLFEAVSKWALSYKFPYSLASVPLKKKLSRKKEILIDGNTSSALGALFAGCQFLSWYPITPATSLAESFEAFSQIYQKDSKGKNKTAVLQAEDELSALSQVIGASWAGLRAMTCTSGPGLSLMAESAGLSYFAEVPAVICHIQRAGPSTGLPTKTQQSDLLSVCFLSHGDSKHVVLFPANAEESFEFTKLAFDLAEELQTLIIVLSDLDLGMNLKISSRFKFPNKDLKRGKVLTEKELEHMSFMPYKDEANDGLSYRTLPGIRHPKGAYLTRGSGHNETADYSEKPEDYKSKLDKLNRKWETAKKLVPKPFIETHKKAKLAFVSFGANESCIQELREELAEKGIFSNYLRVRSFPFSKEVELFLKNQRKIFVVEQNRDAQLKQLLNSEFPECHVKMTSLLQYDGRPLMFSLMKTEFEKNYSAPS